MEEIINSPVVKFVVGLILSGAVFYIALKLSPIKKDIEAIKEDIVDMKKTDDNQWREITQTAKQLDILQGEHNVHAHGRKR